jgi:hypothetical protein
MTTSRYGTFTCEHCGRQQERGTHYVCAGRLVAGRENRSPEGLYLPRTARRGWAQR